MVDRLSKYYYHKVMNNTSVIQVPVKTALKTEATEVARELGFTSLQELLRVMMTRLVAKQLSVSFVERPAFALSAKNDRRYDKIEADFRKGKNIATFDNVGKALAYLNED